MKGNKMIKVYSGTEMSVLALKDRLEKEGINTTIRNDSNNSFLGGVPIAIDMYIKNSDLRKAKNIIDAFN